MIFPASLADISQIMSCLYLTQSGIKISRFGRRIMVKQDEKELLSCPIHHIDRILLWGRIQITSDALSLLLARKIPLCLFNSHGRYRGSLEPDCEKDFRLRQKHYALLDNLDYSLSFARSLVEAKILSARAVLQRYQANHLELKFYRTINDLLELSQAVRNAPSIDSLRGQEGIAARLYFESWRTIFPQPPFQFVGRIRRPPRDPINALLSFSYMLLVGLIRGMLSSHALDPYGGFYHSHIRSAPALVLDILEEFRHPIADRFIFYCLHKKILTLSDFDTLLTGAVTLKEDSRKKYIIRWENWLSTRQRWRRGSPPCSGYELIHNEIDRLAEAIRNGKIYLPFSLEA
jgi:CRISPR-associated protein Cas1